MEHALAMSEAVSAAARSQGSTADTTPDSRQFESSAVTAEMTLLELCRQIREGEFHRRWTEIESLFSEPPAQRLAAQLISAHELTVRAANFDWDADGESISEDVYTALYELNAALEECTVHADIDGSHTATELIRFRDEWLYPVLLLANSHHVRAVADRQAAAAAEPVLPESLKVIRKAIGDCIEVVERARVNWLESTGKQENGQRTRGVRELCAQLQAANEEIPTHLGQNFVLDEECLRLLSKAAVDVSKIFQGITFAIIGDDNTDQDDLAGAREVNQAIGTYLRHLWKSAQESGLTPAGELDYARTQIALQERQLRGIGRRIKPRSYDDHNKKVVRGALEALNMTGEAQEISYCTIRVSKNDFVRLDAGNPVVPIGWQASEDRIVVSRHAKRLGGVKWKIPQDASLRETLFPLVQAQVQRPRQKG